MYNKLLEDWKYFIENTNSFYFSINWEFEGFDRETAKNQFTSW